MAQMQGRLKEAVERGHQKASPEIDTYERLVDDLRERLNEKIGRTAATQPGRTASFGDEA